MAIGIDLVEWAVRIIGTAKGVCITPNPFSAVYQAQHPTYHGYVPIAVLLDMTI